MSSIPSSQLAPNPRQRTLASWARWATLLLMLVMFVCTHIPGHAIPRPIAAADKYAHTLAYLALAFSAITSWELSIGLLRPQHYLMLFLFGTLYGAFDEVTQMLVGRYSDVRDWLCDILGIVLGLLLFRLLRPMIYRLIKSKAAANEGCLE